MNLLRITFAASALLLAAAPMAQASGPQVDISVDLGYYLPAHVRFVREPAPAVMYPPVPAFYHHPMVRPPVHYYPVQYYYGGYQGYRDRDGYRDHDGWRHREYRRHHRDDDDD